MRRPSPHPFVLLAAAMIATGCAKDSADGESSTTRSVAVSAVSTPELEGSVTVSAARSLSDVFTDLGANFEAANPGTEVEFNFDASSSLASQIIEGAQVDVFASADQANMSKVTDVGLVAERPRIFARNELIIITKSGNPDGIDSLADLAEVGVVSLCGEDVPCGSYAASVLEKAGVTLEESKVTRGQNAGATLTAVVEGDAAAGIVYASDARSMGGRVAVVPIPQEHNVTAEYLIGVLEKTEQARLADEFVDYVLSADGQRILVEYGFLEDP